MLNISVIPDKHDKEKAEKERQKQIEKENAERLAREAAEAAKAAAQQVDGEDVETMDGSAEKEEDVIGVPHVVIDVADKTKPASVKVNETGRLPSIEEVMIFQVLLSSHL